MTTLIYPEQKAHVISSDAEAIAKKLPDEFVKRDSERHQQRRLPYEKVKKFSASGLWGITVAKEYGGAFVSDATLTKVGLTQKTSQTLILPCRASCFKSGNPPNALASLCLCGSLRQAASLREAAPMRLRFSMTRA
ncbi:MAG: acyl-CoA dehydrogenase family protein [Nostoc sp.]